MSEQIAQSHLEKDVWKSDLEAVAQERYYKYSNGSMVASLYCGKVLLLLLPIFEDCMNKAFVRYIRALEVEP